MGAETERPIGTRITSMGAANRSFERFLQGINPSFRLDALRPDQKGSYYSHELEQFRRDSEIVRSPEQVEGKIIATITYDHENKKVIIQRPGELPIET